MQNVSSGGSMLGSGHGPPNLAKPQKIFQGNLGLTVPYVNRLR